MKSASTIVTKKFKVVGTNPFSIAIKSAVIEIPIAAMVKLDYYQEYIDLWK